MQGSFYNLSLQWLIKHNFPPGPIHLTRSHRPTLPMYSSVGAFKVEYMQGLVDKGFVLWAAYGNTGTDAKAYEAVGIAKDRCASTY
jgi:phosphatidate phosphatase PAH1